MYHLDKYFLILIHCIYKCCSYQDYHLSYYIIHFPVQYRWRNGKHARVECADRGFTPGSVQTIEYKIGMCCFSAKHAALRRKRKDWLALNQNNVSEWIDMSTRGLLFQ